MRPSPPDGPLWRRVLDDLEERLATGEIGDRFPTDRELVEHYDVSRHTVREAVRHLKARGVVARERGRGSRVVAPEFLQPLGTIYSLFQAVESRGMRQTSEVLALDLQRDERAAELFEVDPTEPLVHLERLRYAAGTPLALDTVWLPPQLARPLLDVNFHHTALYEEMDRLCGGRPSAGTEWITAVRPDDGLCDVLQLDEDEGVLRIERVGRSVDGVAIECRTTLVRGSRFTLVCAFPGAGQVDAVVDEDERGTAGGR